MGIARDALKASQYAGAAIGHDELELGSRTAEGHQAVVRTAAMFMDVGLKLTNCANQALCHLFGQGRQLGRLLRLPAELHPTHRFVLLRIAAGQDSSEPYTVMGKITARLPPVRQR